MATIACVIRSAAICLSMQSDGSYFFFKRINTLFLSVDFFLTSSVVHSFFSDFIFRLFLHSSFCYSLHNLSSQSDSYNISEDSEIESSVSRD